MATVFGCRRTNPELDRQTTRDPSRRRKYDQRQQRGTSPTVPGASGSMAVGGGERSTDLMSGSDWCLPIGDEYLQVDNQRGPDASDLQQSDDDQQHTAHLHHSAGMASGECEDFESSLNA